MTTETVSRDWRWARDGRLRMLDYPSYAAYISSPAWAAVRRRYRASSLPQDCVICGKGKTVLHHKTYERVGEERLEDLAPLCVPCHELVHILERRGDLNLDFDGFVSEQRAKRFKPQRQDLNARKARFVETRQHEDRARASKQRANRLRNFERQASARNVDIAADLDEIDQLIRRIERKLK